MEGYILPFVDWFYKHCGDDYYDFLGALEIRENGKKSGLSIRSEIQCPSGGKTSKPKKKKKKKLKKSQKYTNKNFRRYRPK